MKISVAPYFMQARPATIREGADVTAGHQERRIFRGAGRVLQGVPQECRTTAGRRPGVSKSEVAGMRTGPLFHPQELPLPERLREDMGMHPGPGVPVGKIPSRTVPAFDRTGRGYLQAIEPGHEVGQDRPDEVPSRGDKATRGTASVRAG